MLKNLTSKAAPELMAVHLCRGTLAAALAVADRCFPNPDDQSFLRGHWTRVIEGQVSYYCPDDKDHLTLLDHFVYQVGSEVVAFGGLYRHDKQVEREWLNWFGVDLDQRGRGFGQKIIEHLATVARTRGAITLVGYTEDAEENDVTKRFYESLGFEPTAVYSFRGQEVRLYERKLR